MNRWMVIDMKTQYEESADGDGVSALMDGRLDAHAVAALLQDTQGAAGRETLDTWHVYHLIGDVLRSDDLAACSNDTRVLSHVRAALAQERRPLLTAQPQLQQVRHAAAQAPRAVQAAANDGVFRWKMVAGLASFAAVAAVGWGVLGGIGPQASGGAQLAQGGSGAGAAQVASLSTPASARASSAADPDAAAPVMLRDAQLDELLAAHRAAAGASALANASGFLRNATFEGSGR